MFIHRRKASPVEYYYPVGCPHSYVYWRDAQEECWAQTDDGIIVKVKKVNHITEVRGKSVRVRRRICFYIGNRFAHGKSKYNFLDVAIKFAYGLSERYWWEQQHICEPGIIRVFALLVLGKVFELDKYRYNAFQYSILRTISLKFFNTENNWRHLRSYFNHDKVRAMIQQTIEKILKERNIDVSKVLDLLETAEQKALDYSDKFGNGNPVAILAVADRYAGLLGMISKNNKQLGSGDRGNPGELPGATDTYNKILEDAVVVKEKL